MPEYSYRVKKSPEEILSGVIEAENHQMAVGRLREMGYFPIEVRERGDDLSPLAQWLGRWSNRVALRDVNLFVRQLSDLVGAGVPLAKGLNTIAEQTENPQLVRVIQSLRKDIQDGVPFSESFEKHPKVFSPIYAGMVKAGEAGGVLDIALARLADFGEREDDLRSKVKAALVYPAFLGFVGFATVFILLSFVFPKFVVLFSDFGQALPVPTRILIALSGFMSRFWWLFVLAPVLAVVFERRYASSPEGKLGRDRLWLRVPLFGNLSKKIEVSRFARTFGTLLENGVPMMESLRIVIGVLGNQAVAQEVRNIQERIGKGDRIAACLEKNPIFPPMVGSMTAVGEESGALGRVLIKVADTYDKDLDRSVKIVTTMLEPVLILVLGSIVGFLVISMLLPMFRISTLVG